MSDPVEAVLAGISARRRMQREDEEAADRAKKRKQEDEDRAFTMSERQRGLKLRGDMAQAAAPASLGQAEQAGPVDPASSIPAAAAPLQALPTVNGKSYAGQAEADAAASEYNSPQGMAARQAQVLAGAGEAKAAQDIRTGSMQERSARLKLNADESAELDRRFNDDLQRNVNSWDTFDAFVSKSAGDGMGGKLQLQTTVSADGKKRIVNVVAPDGTLKATGQEFPNTAEGLQLATAELARMTPEKKLQHLHNKAMLERQRLADEERARHNGVVEQLTGDKTAANIEIAGMRTALAQAKAAGGASPTGGLSIGDADKQITGLFTSKNPDTGANTYDALGAQTVRSMMLRMPAAQSGDVQGALNQAYTLYQAALQKAGGDQAKAMQLLADAAKPKAAPSSAAGAAPPTPAGPPIPTDSSGPKAPAAVPEQPGMVARTAGAVGKFFSDSAETGRQMEAIRARVKEADNGGRPLTAAERAQAKQYGITPIS